MGFYYKMLYSEKKSRKKYLVCDTCRYNYKYHITRYTRDKNKSTDLFHNKNIISINKFIRDNQNIGTLVITIYSFSNI